MWLAKYRHIPPYADRHLPIREETFKEMDRLIGESVLMKLSSVTAESVWVPQVLIERSHIYMARVVGLGLGVTPSIQSDGMLWLASGQSGKYLKFWLRLVAEGHELDAELYFWEAARSGGLIGEYTFYEVARTLDYRGYDAWGREVVV